MVYLVLTRQLPDQQPVRLHAVTCDESLAREIYKLVVDQANAPEATIVCVDEDCCWLCKEGYPLFVYNGPVCEGVETLGVRRG